MPQVPSTVIKAMLPLLMGPGRPGLTGRLNPPVARQRIRGLMRSPCPVDDVRRPPIEQVLPNSDVVVHVEPSRRGLTLRDRVLAIALSEPAVSEAHDITIFDHGDQQRAVSGRGAREVRQQ